MGTATLDRKRMRSNAEAAENGEAAPAKERVVTGAEWQRVVLLVLEILLRLSPLAADRVGSGECGKPLLIRQNSKKSAEVPAAEKAKPSTKEVPAPDENEANE